MQPPSDSDSAPLPPPADAPTLDAPAVKTPNLSDTPASADPETPFSDAATASDANASVVVAAADAVTVGDALGDGEDDGINDPSGGTRKHMILAPPAPPSKKSKKKGGSCVWTRSASRKGKKTKQPGEGGRHAGAGGGRRPRPSCGEDEFL